MVTGDGEVTEDKRKEKELASIVYESQTMNPIWLLFVLWFWNLFILLDGIEKGKRVSLYI